MTGASYRRAACRGRGCPPWLCTRGRGYHGRQHNSRARWRRRYMLRRTRSTPLQLCVGQSLDLHIPMKHVSNTKASGRAICDAGGGRGSTGARVAIAPCTSWGGSATAFLLQNTGCLSGNHGGVRSAYRLRTSKSLGVFAPAVAAVTGTLGGAMMAGMNPVNFQVCWDVDAFCCKKSFLQLFFPIDSSS